VIGRPHRNTESYYSGFPSLSPVAIGIPGELYVGQALGWHTVTLIKRR